jgi:hypothetical protein
MKSRSMCGIFWLFTLFGRGLAADTLDSNGYACVIGTIVLSGNPDTGFVLRKFTTGTTTRYLAVDPRTLVTKLFDSSACTSTPQSLTAMRRRFSATPYCKALEAAETNDTSLHDAGITHLRRTLHGIDLTIDLCPSKRPLDRVLFSRLFAAFGLIPIGSDAWLAKGQQPNTGSIVLIHANGNDPLGIDRFIRLVERKHPDIVNKSWLLYDLRESIVATETNTYAPRH